MENKLTIEQCIFQILEIMRQRNFSNGTINCKFWFVGTCLPLKPVHLC
jgi:hypothetical protein